MILQQTKEMSIVHSQLTHLLRLMAKAGKQSTGELSVGSSGNYASHLFLLA